VKFPLAILQVAADTETDLVRHEKAHPGNRVPAPPESEVKSRMARVMSTERQYRKLLRLGGPTWLRAAIDAANEGEQPK
jgi:hypothetical protein